MGDQMAVERTKTPLATSIGVALALGVPFILVLTSSQFSAKSVGSTPVHTVLVREAMFWGLTIIVVLVLRFGERKPLRSIGLRRPTWMTPLLGIAGLVLIYATEPLGTLMLKATGGSVPKQALTFLGSMPIWLLVLITLRAAVCEEILFRGYGIERLTALTGSRFVGAIVPGIIFMAAHAQNYGLRYMLFILPTTVILTALYLWRRDLAANMTTHFLTDALGVATAYAAVHGLIPARMLAG